MKIEKVDDNTIRVTEDAPEWDEKREHLENELAIAENDKRRAEETIADIQSKLDIMNAPTVGRIE